MAYKSFVGTSWIIVASMALGGCQNTPKTASSQQGFTQRPMGSANPPTVPGGQTTIVSGVNPSSTANPNMGNGVPTASPAITGSQSRLTAQPSIPSTGPTPAFAPNFNTTAPASATSFTSNQTPPGSGYNPSAVPPPTFGAGPNGPALESPVLPPANPGFGNVPGVR